ncbi:MAG: host attachment protein [Gammaproteobacteria bacterium]
MTTWVLVADRLRARLLELGKDGKTLVELQDLVHPEARERLRELVDDRRGRESGEWGRQTFEPVTSPREKETAEFVREIGEALEQGLNRGGFDRLVLCAEPRLLGRLREGLPEQVSRRVEGELGKDLAAVARPEELRKRLEEVL